MTIFKNNLATGYITSSIICTIIVLFIYLTPQKVVYKIQNINNTNVEYIKLTADCNVFVVGDTIKLYRGDLVTPDNSYADLLGNNYIIKSITIPK